jgi:mono/diheme cytochrome c family protein
MKMVKIIIGSLVIASIGMSFVYYSGEKNWTAPASANKLKNPVKGNTTATIAGKKIYKQMCAICHGNKGKGDGVAGVSLNPRPANFWKEKIQSQTDGAIYWKLTEGRSPMAGYKASLSDKKRWQLINYIRTFSKIKPKITSIPTQPLETAEEKEIRLKKKLDEKFNHLIKEGDLLLTNKKLKEAQLKYAEALTLKPEDTLVAKKMNALEIRLAEKEKRDALKKEIKEELKTELKTELMEELLIQLKDTIK